MRKPFFLTAMVGAFVAATATPALASNRVPTPLAERHLTIPKRTVRIDGGPRWGHPVGAPWPFPEGELVVRSQNGPGDPAWLNAGATFGLSPKFQLGAVVPVQVGPGDPDLHDPRVHLLYAFLSGDVDIGVFFEAQIPFEAGGVATLTGFPMQFHLGSSVRLDTGPFLSAWLDPDADDSVSVDFGAPFELPINLSPQFFLGPEAGIVTHGEFDSTTFPVGFFIGYTMGGGGETLGDLTFRIRDHDSENFGDTVDLIFAADLYFDL